MSVLIYLSFVYFPSTFKRYIRSIANQRAVLHILSGILFQVVRKVYGHVI